MSGRNTRPHKVTLAVTYFHDACDNCEGHSEPFEGAHREDEYEIEHTGACGPEHPTTLNGNPLVPGLNAPYRCRLEEQLDQYFLDDEPPARSGVYRVHVEVEHSGHYYADEVTAIYAVWEPWADQAAGGGR